MTNPYAPPQPLPYHTLGEPVAELTAVQSGFNEQWTLRLYRDRLLMQKQSMDEPEEVMRKDT